MPIWSYNSQFLYLISFLFSIVLGPVNCALYVYIISIIPDSILHSIDYSICCILKKSESRLLSLLHLVDNRNHLQLYNKCLGLHKLRSSPHQTQGFSQVCPGERSLRFPSPSSPLSEPQDWSTSSPTAKMQQGQHYPGNKQRLT